jgi:hypothetical protein
MAREFEQITDHQSQASISNLLALRITLRLQEDKPSTHQKKVKWIKMV